MTGTSRGNISNDMLLMNGFLLSFKRACYISKGFWRVFIWFLLKTTTEHEFMRSCFGFTAGWGNETKAIEKRLGQINTWDGKNPINQNGSTET